MNFTEFYAGVAVASILAAAGFALVSISNHVGSDRTVEHQSASQTVTVGSFRTTEAKWRPEGYGWKAFPREAEEGDKYWNPFTHEQIQIIRKGDSEPTVSKPSDFKPDFNTTGLFWRSLDDVDVETKMKFLSAKTNTK
jgi:hypothetical protein